MAPSALRRFRTSHSARALSLLALASFLFTSSGCAVPQVLSLHRLSAQEIYAGIFFGAGPASTLLPEVYQDGSPYQRAAAADPAAATEFLRTTAARLQAAGDGEGAALVRNAVGAVQNTRTPLPKHGGAADARVSSLRAGNVVASTFIAQIERQNPGFFRGFDAAVRSGDPVRVSAAIQAAGEESYRAGKVMLLDYERIDASVRAACVVAAVVLVAAAAVALAVVVWSVFALVEGVVVAAGPLNAQRNGTLLYDELVARVTLAFASPAGRASPASG
jgi:SdpC family antimicrobial peptide